MKVIFLDFEGVIDNWQHLASVDEKNAKVLKKIVD